jgi:hypothetical protein
MSRDQAGADDPDPAVTAWWKAMSSSLKEFSYDHLARCRGRWSAQNATRQF